MVSLNLRLCFLSVKHQYTVREALTTKEFWVLSLLIFLDTTLITLQASSYKVSSLIDLRGIPVRFKYTHYPNTEIERQPTLFIFIIILSLPFLTGFALLR